MPMLKKAMIYLGLGPDEHYASYEDPNRPAHGQSPAGGYPGGSDPTGQGVSVAAGQAPGDPVLGRTVRPISLAAATGAAEPDDLGAGRPTGVAQAPGVVHSLPSRIMKPHAVSPDSFNDAQDIGDRFKSGQPVIVNLQAVDRDLRRRLVDFSSGLCYAMGGKMDRVADQVYLLTPADVEVSHGTTRRRG